MEQFAELLHENSRLPLALLALRYENLYLCYQIIEQVGKLQDLFNNYRKVCIFSVRSSLRKKICHTFQEILQLISDISQQVVDQEIIARFQEKRLVSIYEEVSKS
jgi:hypothetical protein